MYLQQEHLPKPEDAVGDEKWGFTFWEFIQGNWIYLGLIVLILVIFLYARHSWRKRHQNKR